MPSCALRRRSRTRALDEYLIPTRLELEVPEGVSESNRLYPNAAILKANAFDTKGHRKAFHRSESVAD